MCVKCLALCLTCCNGRRGLWCPTFHSALCHSTIIVVLVVKHDILCAARPYHLPGLCLRFSREQKVDLGFKPRSPNPKPLFSLPLVLPRRLQPQGQPAEPGPSLSGKSTQTLEAPRWLASFPRVLQGETLFFLRPRSGLTVSGGGPGALSVSPVFCRQQLWEWKRQDQESWETVRSMAGGLPRSSQAGGATPSMPPGTSLSLLPVNLSAWLMEPTSQARDPPACMSR